jgi:hypothetical protein
MEEAPARSLQKRCHLGQSHSTLIDSAQYGAVATAQCEDAIEDKHAMYVLVQCVFTACENAQSYCNMCQCY